MVSDFELVCFINSDIEFLNDDHELRCFNKIRNKVYDKKELNGTEKGRLSDLYNTVQRRSNFK